MKRTVALDAYIDWAIFSSFFSSRMFLGDQFRILDEIGYIYIYPVVLETEEGSALFGSRRTTARGLGTPERRSGASAPRPTCWGSMSNLFLFLFYTRPHNGKNSGTVMETSLKHPFLSNEQGIPGFQQKKMSYRTQFCTPLYDLRRTPTCLFLFKCYPAAGSAVDTQIVYPILPIFTMPERPKRPTIKKSRPAAGFPAIPRFDHVCCARMLMCWV